MNSFPDMVFFQFPDDKLLWFGEHHGNWAWMHGSLYAALPPALLHGMSAGMLDPVYVRPNTAITSDFCNLCTFCIPLSGVLGVIVSTLLIIVP